MRSRCARGCEHLRNLPFASNLTECVCDMHDGIVCRSVEEAESTTNRGAVIAENIPGEAHSWRDVVFVCGNRIPDIVQLVAHSQIHGEVLFDLPSVLNIDARVRFG